MSKKIKHPVVNSKQLATAKQSNEVATQQAEVAAQQNADVVNSSVAASATAAAQTAQPGVIATLQTLLLKAKADNTSYTAAQYTSMLADIFTQRKSTGLAITVRAQLSRLPKEKQFAISKSRVGRNVLYAAA